MEESKISENRATLPADNMKAPSAHGEIKELIFHKPSNQDEVLKADPGIPSAEKKPEEKKLIPTEAVANTGNQEQTLNKTVSFKSLDIKPNNTQPPKEEPNSKENSLKSQASAKKQNEAKESTAAKEKTSKSKSKPPIEDHQKKETTKADKKDKSKDTTKAFKKEKPSAAKKPEKNGDQTITPDTQDQGNSKETQLEEDGRKTWKSLLKEVSLVSSLSTFRLLYDKASTPEISKASDWKRNAKDQYKKKIKILKENFAYRMGLLRQLKETMKQKYNSEAQQLYSDYTSSKREHRLQKDTSKHADSKESLVTDPSEEPVSVPSGLEIKDSELEPGLTPAGEDKDGT